MADDVFEWRPAQPREPFARWAEDDVIGAAVAAYQRYGCSSYALAERPDHINRRGREIDAILRATDCQPVALEHTQLQSFAGQLMDDKRVNDLLAPLNETLSSMLPRGLWCIVPTHAFVAGSNWVVIRDRIVEFLRSVAPTLAPGTATHVLPGVPFSIHLKYEPRLATTFRFTRASPSQTDIRRDLVASMEAALEHKRERLAEYARDGYRAVLLIESADMSLISHVEPYQAYIAASQTVPEHAQDVLFAQTGDWNRIYVYGFRGEEQFLNRLNVPNLKLGARYLQEWTGEAETA
jgi:hypothetical protein